MFKMLIGMTFITVVADVLISGSKYKKYVNSVIGIFIVTLVVQGISGFKDITPNYGIIEEIEKDAEKSIVYAEDEIKKEMMKNAAQNIKELLVSEGISVNEISLDIDSNYNITFIKIKLTDISYKDKVISLLSERLYIDKSVIEAG